MILWFEDWREALFLGLSLEGFEIFMKHD